MSRRRPITRRDRLKINRAIGLREIKEDLRYMLREHRTLAITELEAVADKMFVDAFSKVPVDSGDLQDSIQVSVSRSPRYPGIIATAEAHNFYTGYDYALIQEINEEYNHPNGGQAHYLEEPFREAVSEFYRRMGWE